jgi:Putative binding domain, N-terminal
VASFDVTQAGVACVFTVGAPSVNPIPAAGGSFDVGVTAPVGCSWTASPSSSFITLATGSGSGSGDGKATFNVGKNDGGERPGAVTVAGKTVNVTQSAAAPTCSYKLDSKTAKLSSLGAPDRNQEFVLDIHTTAGCSWNFEAAGSTFVTAIGAISGADEGAITFRVDRNRTTADRDVRVRIKTSAGDQVFTIRQAHPTALINISWKRPDGLPAQHADIDLQLIEPSGKRVYYQGSNKDGDSSYLLKDNKPEAFTGTEEQIYIDHFDPPKGTYQILFTHTGGGGEDAVSTITVTFGLYTSSPEEVIFTARPTFGDSTTWYYVADVDPATRFRRERFDTKP